MQDLSGGALSRTEKTFIVFYFLFLLGFFVNTDHDDHYVVYGFLLAPFTLVVWRSWQLLLLSTPLICVSVFLCYLAVSFLWSHPDGTKPLLEVSSKIGLTFSFVLITSYIAGKYPAQFTKVLSAMIISVALIGLISMALFYAKHPFPSGRLVSFGQLNNPGLMGSVNGVFAVIACYFAISTKSLKPRALYALVFLVMFAVVAMAQARSAFIAMMIAIMVLVIFQERHRWVQYSITVCVLIGTYIFGRGIFTRFLTAGIDNSSDLRIQIWQDAFAQIATHPFFGAGIGTSMNFTTTGGVFHHPHSVYLSVTWYGGILGILLLLGVMAAAYRECIIEGRRNDNYLALALMVYTSICIFVDYGDLVKYPHDIWLQFWLVVAMAGGLAIRRRSNDKQAAGLNT